MSIITLGTDINGIPVYSIPFPNEVEEKENTGSQGAEVKLVANTEATLTIPIEIKRIYISYNAGASVYVGKNLPAPITVPSSPGIFVASLKETNPAVREVKAGDIIHFVAEDTDTVTVRFDEATR